MNLIRSVILVLSIAIPLTPVLAQDEPDQTQQANPPPEAEAPQAVEASQSHSHHRHHAGHRMFRRSLTVPVRFRAHKTAQPARQARNAQRHPVDQLKLAEREGFKKVSDLVAFPPFFPGLGIVTVKPDTLPVGPFRTFDRKDRLISTVYMLPLKDMDDHKRWDNVKGLPAPADHATFYFHPGHPGVEMPHYHLVIWHVSRKDEDLVAK